MHVPLTPIRCLQRALDHYPKKVGVVAGKDRFTYEQFADRCQRMAAGIVAAGVMSGDRVAFLSFNTNVLLEGYFAAPLAGAIVMPLNVRLHPSELQRVVVHAEPKILFYEREFTPTIELIRQAAPGCVFVSIDDDTC